MGVLTNFDDLQVEIANWLNRQDLSARIPTFVRLIEAQVERSLRLREMVQRAYAQIPLNSAGSPQEYVPLPGDYLEMKSVKLVGLDTPRQPLDYAPNTEIDRLQYEAVVAREPTDYGIVGDSLRLAPYPDAQYNVEITYYARIPRLSDTNQRNWLLIGHPDLYLYGALMQAAPYLKDDDRVAMWNGAVNSMLDDLRLAGERAEKSGQPIKARLRSTYG